MINDNYSKGKNKIASITSKVMDKTPFCKGVFRGIFRLLKIPARCAAPLQVTLCLAVGAYCNTPPQVKLNCTEPHGGTAFYADSAFIAFLSSSVLNTRVAVLPLPGLP